MAEPGTCGACRAFVATAGHDDTTRRGRCHLRPEMGTIPATLPRCPRYVERGTGATWTPPKVAGGPRGQGSTAAAPGRSATAAASGRDEPASRRSHSPAPYGPPLPATIDLGGDSPMDTQALRQLMREILHEEGVVGDATIAPRFADGTLLLQPRDPAQKAKDMPIATFFHKIVMIRDRLRVLEQKLNAHAALSVAEKADLQQGITRIYGSLTSFNVLFADRADGFAGTGTGSD